MTTSSSHRRPPSSPTPRAFARRGLCLTWGTAFFIPASQTLLLLTQSPYAELGSRLRDLLPTDLGGTGPGSAFLFGLVMVYMQGAICALWMREVLRDGPDVRLFRPVVANALAFAVAAIVYALCGRIDEAGRMLLYLALTFLTLLLEPGGTSARPQASVS